jgi:hypothetical protein
MRRSPSRHSNWQALLCEKPMATTLQIVKLWCKPPVTQAFFNVGHNQRQAKALTKPGS